MYNKKIDDCIDYDNCINNPSKLSCNIACPDTKKNCYESYKVFAPQTYAKACIALQPYQNLFNISDAFVAGTIFKDLYSPYCAIKYSEEVKK